MYFCFRLKVTLCVNDGFNSNSSSEEEVEYSAASFLTVGCSHPKMKEQNYQRKKKQNIKMFFNIYRLFAPALSSTLQHPEQFGNLVNCDN